MLIFLAILAFFLMIIKILAATLTLLAIPLLITGLIFGFLLVIHHIFLIIYFKSNKFKIIKNSIKAYIDNCNELNDHINDLKNSFINIKQNDYGKANLNNSSQYNYKRNEWKKYSNSNFVYNCSATICKNAKDQPFKYLCKYFNIEITEDSLSEFENIFNDFSSAEQGKTLLRTERDTIIENIKTSIPWYIFKFSKKRLIKELGFNEINFDDFYFPVYTFQYISPGGNSSTNCKIELELNNLEKFIEYLNSLIKFRKSVQGQRALMTSSLREKIKNRDNFTCQKCSLSIYDERNLLLEIDHIIPLSKGGITTELNLQTLCWRCNRTKGSRIENKDLI